MSWNTYYLPPNNSDWQGRRDAPRASCFFQIIQLLNLNKPFPALSCPIRFALIGFSCDEGIRRNLGRVGAIYGPSAIRKMLGPLAIQRPNISCYDAGDIICDDENLEEAQTTLSEIIFLLLNNGFTPIVMGGGHELAFGHYQGITKKYFKENIGIINFDAHLDMRPMPQPNLGSSGSPFLQIALSAKIQKRLFDYNCIGLQPQANTTQLIETAKEHQVKIIWADEVHLADKKKCSDFVAHAIHRNQLLYVSLCLDVFASAYAPGVSAPQSLGLTPWQVIPLLRQLAASSKTMSYDIAELSPKYDIDERTAKLAANFIFEIVHHHQR